MPRERRSPFSHPLCPSLELRYSISVVACPATKYRCQFYNSARFSLYSAVNKRIIGKVWHTTFRCAKKELAHIAVDGKPLVHVVTEKDKINALKNLLTLNIDLANERKESKTKTKNSSVPLNNNVLLDFWLTNFSSIYALVTAAQSAKDVNNRIAKLFFNYQIASFDLSSLCTLQQDSLVAVCHSIVDQIRQIITGNRNKTTDSVYEAVQLIRYAVAHYLNDKNNIIQQTVDEILRQESQVKAGAARKAADAMQPKSFSIAQFQMLWDILIHSGDALHIAILVMLYLGLTPEEVCGLQKEDYQQIFEYSGFYQLRITHKYSKYRTGYRLDVLNGTCACRNIPIPQQIQTQIDALIKRDVSGSLFLFNDRAQPLKPEVLMKKLNELFNTPFNAISITDNNKRKKEINIGYHVESYRESCRYYWQYYFGLTPGEIRYLSALTPQDTLSIHYVDYNNGSMQFRMLKQLEYGLALFIKDPDAYAANQYQTNWEHVSTKSFCSSGRLSRRASMALHITSPSVINFSSKRGLKIYIEGNDK